MLDNTITLVLGSRECFYYWKLLHLHSDKKEIMERIKGPDFVAAFKSTEEAKEYCNGRNFPEG